MAGIEGGTREWFAASEKQQEGGLDEHGGWVGEFTQFTKKAMAKIKKQLKEILKSKPQ